MIVNPGKFQAIILDKKKNNHIQEIIKIPFRSMLRLVKILKLSKILLKIGMVVHVTVGYVRVELN